jgi:ribonucleoside-diphosphate reductase alpha chain
LLVSKQGSTVRGLCDGVALAVSIGLQYGVPLQDFVDKYKGTRFDPAGITDDTTVKIATSVLDYVFRWLESKFDNGDGSRDSSSEKPHLAPSLPPCPVCGGLTERTGTCSRCINCGESTGCSG